MDCNNSTSLNDEGEVPAKAVRKVKSFESNEACFRSGPTKWIIVLLIEASPSVIPQE